MNFDIPKKTLNNPQSRINTFIWKFKAARIKTSIWQQAIEKGYVEVLLDILHYNKTA